MTDTTAKIRAKGLDATGVTEDIAAEMYHNKGRHYMAIVELRVDETHDKADGTRKVDLVLTQVEPAADDSLAEHLRELTRTLYYNRGTNPEQLSLQHGDEPTVAAVLEAGAKHRPHPFLPVDASDEHPLCDVCGYVEAAGVHSRQDVLPDDDEDDDEAQLDPALQRDLDADTEARNEATAAQIWCRDCAPDDSHADPQLHASGEPWTCASCSETKHESLPYRPASDVDPDDLLVEEPDNVTTLRDPFTTPA